MHINPLTGFKIFNPLAVKKTILLFLLVAFLKSNAQVVTYSYDSDVFIKLQKSTLYVVLTDNPTYDSAITKAATNYWKVTPFEFINMKDINTVIDDENNSFLAPFLWEKTIKHGLNEKYKDYTSINSWLWVINGGRKKLANYSVTDVICLAAFNYGGDEHDYVAASYRLDYMVKAINDGIQLVADEKIYGSFMNMPSRVFEKINKNTTAILKTKTLIINRETKLWDSNKNLVDSTIFKEAKYPYKYEYVSNERFKELMAGTSSEFLLLVPAVEANKHISIYDPATRNTVYSGFAMLGLKVTKGDIEDIMDGKR